MPAVVVPIQYVYDDRLGDVCDFLRPLRDGKEVPCTFVPGQRSKGIVISTRDERGRSSEYTEWRFRANPATRIWYHYYEIWRQIDGSQDCMLFRAYLHVYLMVGHELVQYACLHSDPNEEATDPASQDQATAVRHKRGPHLHILKADPPMPDCHFPLNLGQLEDVLASAEKLTEALKDGIKVVDFEVARRFLF